MGNEVRIKASVTGNAKQEIGSLRGAWDKFQKEGSVGVKAGLTAAAAAKGFSLLDTAISGAIGVMGDAVSAALEDEASIQKLGTSLKANVKGWDGNTDAIERTLQARMKLGFSDDEQRDSLAKLVAATHDVNKALAIERTAMDLARFKGISLADATDALTKVEAGQYRALKSLGIVLKDGATQQDALNAVQAVASGQAEEYANTTGGKLLAAQVKANEALEKLGYQVLPAVADGLEAVSGALDGVTGFLDLLNGKMPETEDGWKSITDTINSLNPATWALSGAINNVKTAADDLAHEGLSPLKDEAQQAESRFGGAYDKATLLGQSILGVDDASKKATDDAKNLRKAIDDLTDAANNAAHAFGDQQYDADSLRGKLADLQNQYDDARKALEKLEAIKHPTKAQQRDIDIAKGKLSDFAHEIFDTRVDLAKLDKTTLKSVLDQLSKAQYRTDKLGDEAREALDLFRKLSYAEGKVTGTSADPGYAPRAGGGPLMPGGKYIVGENGPERIVMGPSGGGMVIPGGGGSAKAAGNVITVNFYPTGVMTPAVAEQIRRELEPILRPLFG